MEVHARTVTERKKLTHYPWEFVSLCLPSVSDKQLLKILL